MTKVEHHFKEWPDYCDNVVYLDTDFVALQKNKAIFTTADVKFDGELEREVYKDLKNREYLFSQRRKEGFVAIHPAELNPQKVDVFYLFVRSRSIYPVREENVVRTVEALKHEMKNRERTEVAVCVCDGGRGGVRWGKFYKILSDIFSDTEIRVYVCKFFYSSQRKERTNEAEGSKRD